jgi:hypothetical protein
MTNMHLKLIKVEKGLSLNQVIRFMCIYTMKDFLNVEDLNWCQEEIIYFKSLKELMTIPIK